MLDLSYVREHGEDVEAALRRRGMEMSLEPLRELDGTRRAVLVEVEALKKHRNESSRKIGQLIKAGEDPAPLKNEMRQVGEKISTLGDRLKEVEDRLRTFMLELPNMPHESVPEGLTPEDNPVVRTWGERPSFDFEAKAHWDLGPALGILDFERATKIAGARFVLYIGDGARLERALIQFMLELHTTEHGYTEVLPPFMVNADALVGTGQLPKFEEDLFKTIPGDYYLVPTAEVPVTNIHAGEILDGERLPIAYTAFTPCFRSHPLISSSSFSNALGVLPKTSSACFASSTARPVPL